MKVMKVLESVKKENGVYIAEYKEVEVKGEEIQYDMMRNEMNGWLESFHYNRRLAENNICTICDDEGKLKDLVPTISVLNDLGELIDFIHGKVIFTSSDEEGRSIGLNKNQTMIIEEELRETALIKIGDKVVETRIMWAR